MAAIVLSGLTKRFGSTTVVDGIDLTVEDRELMVLVGPSGCGKSTVLRMVAGLEEASAGTVAIGGRVVNDLPPKDRDIAMVFQSYALYPHMPVRRTSSTVCGCAGWGAPSASAWSRASRRAGAGTTSGHLSSKHSRLP